MNAEIVIEARRWIGTPYVHQASCLGAGCDCLGLVRGVWRAVIGPEPEPLPAYTRDWGEVAGEERLRTAGERHFRPLALDRADAGDVVLFRMRDRAVAKHLGIMARDGAGRRTLIHAWAGHGVTETLLSGPWARRAVAAFAFPDGLRGI